MTTAPLSRRARLVMAITTFVNQRGIYFGPRSGKVHVALYRLSGGKIGGHFPAAPGVPILLLDHTGAKSGIRRTSPLMYLREGDAIAVVASKAGQPTHPAWFHNLVANPDTAVQLGSEVRNVRARVASDAERERLWPKVVGLYPAYGTFQRMAKDRQLPIVILEAR